MAIPLGVLLIVELASRRYDTGHDQFLCSLCSRMPWLRFFFPSPATSQRKFFWCSGLVRRCPDHVVATGTIGPLRSLCRVVLAGRH